jgi:signal transduction histidine kinase
MGADDPAVRLQRVERDLNELAFAASHDLQAPLWHARGFLELLFRHLTDDLGIVLDDTTVEYRDFAMSALDRLQRMVDGLLEYSRISARARPFVPVALDGCVHDAIAELERTHGEGLAADVVVESLPVVDGDEQQLNRMLWHLLDNACVYRSPARSLRIVVDATRSADEWEIRIRDNGVGMDQPDQERVMSMLRRNHAEELPGIGMGLPICRRIAERHGGSIRLESATDVGTTVLVCLPDPH